MLSGIRTDGPTAGDGLRFDEEFLHTLERLELVSRRAYTSQHRGNRMSRVKGHGLEFADHRGYASGDDFRRIDWNASRRTNRLLIRLCDEERDLPVYLLLDASQSMAEPIDKFDQARRLAAALCYIGLASLDRVTLVPFGDRLQPDIPVGRGKARIFEVFRSLERLAPSTGTALDAVFAEFARRRVQRGVAVVLSDFLDSDGFETGLRRLAGLGHDTFIVHLTSATDGQAGALGDVRFEDAESGLSTDVDLTPGLAAAYRRAWTEHTAALERCCATCGLTYLRAEAETPIEDVMLRTFRLGGFVA